MPVGLIVHCVAATDGARVSSCPEAPFNVKAPLTACVAPEPKVKVSALETDLVKL